MHLLHTTTKRLSSFFDERRPPYAILSHTWGTEEVSFQDLNVFHEGSLRQQPSSSLVSSRAGWRKIEACCHQALQDNFEWVWIDTCCIDKSSSAELSEAINSMFAWYKDSKVCYAFLSDVDEAVEDISAPNSSFRRSSWFTRGWTLQELLAPRRIIFFSSGWQVIGELTKGSKLSEVASEITSIQPAFLEGFDLRRANVAVRMSWASERVTTRKEDMAYCLLGIFDVNMPLLYGEGTKAFDRLQEEILKRTYDHSLFAWGLLPWDQGYTLPDTDPCGILATSVADFAGCGSHNICPRFAENPSKDYQMTNEGLRIQLPLRTPHTREERRNRKFVAILDCYSRQEPSRRIGIPLQSVRKRRTNQPGGTGWYEGTQAEEGDVFIRTGRVLLLSDIHPDAQPAGYKYISRTIQIATANDVARYQLPEFFHTTISIDFPPHYRYDVEYIHPWYEMEKDPYTVKLSSLRIKRRPERVIEPDSRFLYAHGFIEHCSAYWALWCNILTNIIRGRLPFSEVRPRPDSIMLCVKLTRKNHVNLISENHALREDETPYFMAILATMPVSAWNSPPWLCCLAPLPQHSSHMQSAYPSSLFHDLMGYRSLTVANETLIVRDLTVLDNWNNLNPAVLFKIDVKTHDYLVLKVPVLQQIWEIMQESAKWVYGCRYVLGTLVAYGFVIACLSYWGPTNSHSLYLAIWTLCFMPLIYEMRRNRFGSSRLIIVSFGCGFIYVIQRSSQF